MLDGGEYSPCSESSEPFSCINTLTATGKKKRNKNKRRFNNDQIKLLETMFESESRPEPRKKVQLARDLGLQPRQVAIWFQNKRARWKSKQIEQDYSILRSNYNSLASRFEILKKEKQALVVQLQKLNDMVQKSQDESQSGREVLDNKTRSELCNGETARSESEVKTTSSVEVSEHGLGVLSDDDISMKAEYFGLEEEPPLLNMVEPANSPLTSQEDWSRLETDGLFEQSSNTYQWWDFWS